MATVEIWAVRALMVPHPGQGNLHVNAGNSQKEAKLKTLSI